MKLHKVLVQGIIDTLLLIFDENIYADQAIQRTFKKNNRWGARDRGFVAENVYDITRYFRYYTYRLNFEDSNPVDWWAIVGLHFSDNKIELPDWQEWKNLNLNNLRPATERKIIHSIPDWIDNKGLESFSPEIWGKTLAMLNQKALMYIRRNEVKINEKEFEKALLDDNISFQKIDGTTYAIERANIFGKNVFQNGYFEIQDISSQQVAHFMNIQPEMRVIDACAGGGGKSLHIASLLNNKGTVISMDVEEWKLNELKKRAKRNGLFNIQTQLIQNSKTIKRLSASADRVLLDVPCSGLGVLRRNPDAKWKMTEERLIELINTQKEILSSYSRMVKVDGLLIYVTCSILNNENDNQINAFLASNNQFELIEMKTILPQDLNGDGFFMAKLKRVN